MFNRTCKLCGKPFESKSGRKMYCTTTCKDRGKPSAKWQGRENAPAGLHGASAYRRGCRCDTCREAQRLNIRAYNEFAKARDGVAPYTRYRRETRGVDPYAKPVFPDCSACGDPLEGPGNPDSAKPLHKRCKPGAFYVHPDVRREVFERDEWTCTICNHPVEPESNYLSDWYPTLDHIIPQSAQLVPDHSPENLRLACRYCNLARGNRFTTDEDVARRANERRMATA